MLLQNQPNNINSTLYSPYKKQYLTLYTRSKRQQKNKSERLNNIHKTKDDGYPTDKIGNSHLFSIG